MNRFRRSFIRTAYLIIVLAVSPVSLSRPAAAGEYDHALKGVKGVRAVFDVSQGSPKMANAIFTAVKDVYQDETVQALPEKPKVVVVFRGPAVKLISKERSGLKEEQYKDLEKFHGAIRQLKKDGVTLEVCLFAAKGMGIEPATILPEIDRVGNGFISVLGYQAQGYGAVAIP